MRSLSALFVVTGALLVGAQPAADTAFPKGLRGPCVIHVEAEPGPLEVTVTKHDLNLHPGIQRVPVRDTDGTVLHVFELAEPARDVVWTVPADVGRRDGLWCLDIARTDVQFDIGGVELWTADPRAYLDTEASAPTLTPVSVTRLTPPGGAARYQVTLHNRGEDTAAFRKLTIDRRGRLFLSYNHWTSNPVHRTNYPQRYHHRAMLTSNDAGDTWKLAATRDFLP